VKNLLLGYAVLKRAGQDERRIGVVERGHMAIILAMQEWQV
jgi:hypothetical protein